MIEAIPGVTQVGFGDPVPGDERHLALRRITNELGIEVSYYDGSLSSDIADVLGERLPIYAANGSEVIGVLDDVSSCHPSEPVDPFAYRYISTPTFLEAVVESTLSGADLQQAINGLILDGALEVPVSNLTVRSLRDLRNEWIATDRARGTLNYHLRDYRGRTPTASCDGHSPPCTFVTLRASRRHSRQMKQ